jgi:hydroxylamine reductase
VKGIRLGPILPAFVSPNVLKVLVDNFDIKPITTAEEDLKAIVGSLWQDKEEPSITSLE